MLPARFCYVRDRSQLDRAWARKFRTKFDAIAFEFDAFEYMFDVIVNEVKKYSPSARKFEPKADKHLKPLNAIAIVQVKTNREAVSMG